MIRRIICFSLLGCLFIAITLKSFGVTKVSLSGGFLAFLRGTALELQDYQHFFTIPSIPKIDKIAVDGWNFLNVPIAVVNTLSSLVNFVILITNILIWIVVYIGLLIANFITLAKYGWELPRVFPYLNVLSSYLS